MTHDSRLVRGLLWLVTALVAAFALAVVVGAAAASVQPVALDYGEPILYGQATRLLYDEPLYQSIDRPPYTVAAYTPLFYLVGAALQGAVGPGFGPGRVLSLLGGLASAVLVGLLASFGQPRARLLQGALAAALFLAFGFPGEPGWLGLYRVDLLGVALSLGALVVLQRGQLDRRAVVYGGLLAGLALLTKQTFFSAALAGTVWLLTIDRRAAATFAVIVLLVVAVPCAILEASTHAFIQNTVVANVNPFDRDVLAALTFELLSTLWLPLVLAAISIAVCRPWRTSEGRLLLLYGLSATLPLVALAKVGANHNYWIELAAIASVLAARGVFTLTVRYPYVPVAVAALVLAAVGGIEGTVVTAEAARAHVRLIRMPPGDEAFVELVRDVRDADGGVLAEPMDVVVFANRPVLFEPLIYGLLLRAGLWHPGPLVAGICDGQVSLLVLAYSLEEGAEMGFGHYELWPPVVMKALRTTMRFERMQAGRYVYVPDSAKLDQTGCADV